MRSIIFVPLVLATFWALAFFVKYRDFMPDWAIGVAAALFLVAIGISLFNKGDGAGGVDVSTYVIIVAMSLLAFATIFVGVSNSNLV
jgi:hypothetical protein